MNNVYSLGEMAHDGASGDSLLDYFQAISVGESTVFTLFCNSLNLLPADGICVALWLYLNENGQSVQTAEMLNLHHRLKFASPDMLRELFFEHNGHITLHPIAQDFLFECSPRLPDDTELIIPGDEDIVCAEALIDEIHTLLHRYMTMLSPAPAVFSLCGEEGSGRRFAVSSVCRRIGADMLVAGNRCLDVSSLVLIAKLYGAVVCFRGLSETALITARRLGFVFTIIEEIPKAQNGFLMISRNVPLPCYEKAEALIKSCTGINTIPPDIVQLILTHCKTPGKILDFSLRLRLATTGGSCGTEQNAIKRLMREQCHEGIDGATLMPDTGGLSELSLPEELTVSLKQLCAFIAQRTTLYGRWGYERKLPWGRGISALFYGAPGTGKTRAAAAMSAETGLPVYRVDLSQMISKYVGETQKNIGRIFDNAAKADAILFFDEADALFARRVETSDAQDKYANAETAYLLQRMERYDGVCILATNLMQNFDEAFRRRIGYMLHFPMPDAHLRERLWRGSFTSTTPLDEIDWVLLANELELSGASIQMAALHAAYLAAAEHVPVGMKEILSGAKNEYRKQGKSLSAKLSQLFSVWE